MSGRVALIVVWLTYAAAFGASYAFFRIVPVLPTGLTMNPDRAFFAAADAVTATGFRQPLGSVDAYRPVGRAVTLAAMACNGVILLSLGAVAGVRVVNASHLTPLRPGIFRGAGVLAGVWVCGTVALLAFGRTPADAAFDATAAVLNAGVTARPTDLSDGRTGPLATYAVLLPLAAVGGVGIVPLAVLTTRRRLRDPFTLTALGVTATLFLVSTGAFVADGAVLPHAVADALNTRTSGYPLGRVGTSASHDWLIIVGMTLGGVAGGTAGGFIATTVVGLTLSRQAARAIGLYVGTFLLLIVAGQATLLRTAPQLPPDESLFHVVSASTNTGLSREPIALTRGGLFALGTLMLAGRLTTACLLVCVAIGCNGSAIRGKPARQQA